MLVLHCELAFALWAAAVSTCATAAELVSRPRSHHHHTSNTLSQSDNALTSLVAHVLAPMDDQARRAHCVYTGEENTHGRPPLDEYQQPAPLIFEPSNGWGDQLRGLVTAHYVALMTCRPFKVRWTRSFSLNTYFAINFDLVSTRDASQAADVVAQVNTYDFFRDEANLARLATLTNMSTILRTNAYQWLEVCRHPRFRRTAEYYGLAGLSRYELFALGLRALMPRPAPKVRHAVNELLGRDRDTSVTFGTRRLSARPSSAGHGPVIGVQLRTGGAGEEWRDQSRYPISSVACYMTEIRRLCSGSNCAVFLTTDSQLASAEFRKELGSLQVRVLEWPGSILHTDRPVPVDTNPAAAGTRDVWEKTFLDWTTLSQVDVLLMSRSGFAWTAAWAGTVPYVRELGLHRGDGCTWKDFDTSHPLDLKAVPCKAQTVPEQDVRR